MYAPRSNRPVALPITGAALAAFAALLPFQAIAHWPTTDWLRFGLGDWLLALCLPWLTVTLWRGRTAVGSSWMCRSWMALSIAGTVSLLVHGGVSRSPVELVRVWAPSIVIAAFVAAGDDARRRALAGAVWGGWAALALGVTGYVLSAVNVLPRPYGDPLFATQGPHPIFDGFLRFAGTFGFSSQSMGDYLLVWLALLAASRCSRRQRLAGLVVGGGAVLLTFASSWVGLPLVAAASLVRLDVRPSRWLAACALAASVALWVGSSWLMNFGLPDPRVDPSERFVEAPCSGLDVEHHVTRVAASGGACLQVVTTWPYASRLTTYRHAKEVAWRAFGDAPWFGIGPGQFRGAARENVQALFGRAALVMFYQSPHSDPFGVLAERGLIGLLVLVGWASIAASQRTRIDWADPRIACALGLALIGLNADLLHQRFVWVLAGVVATSEVAGRGDRTLPHARSS